MSDDDPLELAVWATHEISMRTAGRITAVLDDLRLTHPTAQVLWAVDPQAPPPSMKVLAARVHCNAPNLSFLVNQLVDRGYAERVADPADRRSRAVVLTEEGRRARERVLRATLDGSPFARCDPDDLRRLAQDLARVLGGAQADGTAPDAPAPGPAQRGDGGVGGGAAPRPSR